MLRNAILPKFLGFNFGSLEKYRVSFQEIKEVNVFTAWRQLLEENEKISKARLAAVQVSMKYTHKKLQKGFRISK